MKENNLKSLIESDYAIPLLLMPYKGNVLSLDQFGYLNSKLRLHIPCINKTGI